MDDILGHLEAAFWAFLGKAGTFCLEALDAAGRKAMELLAGVSLVVERLAQKLATVPWWLSVPGAVLLLGLFTAYLFRQRLYDRVLVYHLLWLKQRGFSRQVFRIRRGAVRETRQAMARRLPLPERFPAIAVFEVHPDKYAVGYGLADGRMEELRLYRRDLRAGISAMADDLAAYYRANVRMLHADSEVRALFAALDVLAPDFAARRPQLPGEAGRAAPGRQPAAA